MALENITIIIDSKYCNEQIFAMIICEISRVCDDRQMKPIKLTCLLCMKVK